MANIVFNIAKGKVNGYAERVANNDPGTSTLVVMLLRTAVADATMRDYDTFADILSGSSTEANFTNYGRVVYTDADLTAPTPDDANDRQNADIPDAVWLSAGGTADNTTAKLIVGYDATGAGADSGIVPLTAQDFVATTNGGDLTAVIDPDGFYSAQ